MAAKLLLQEFPSTISLIPLSGIKSRAAQPSFVCLLLPVTLTFQEGSITTLLQPELIFLWELLSQCLLEQCFTTVSSFSDNTREYETKPQQTMSSNGGDRTINCTTSRVGFLWARRRNSEWPPVYESMQRAACISKA